MKRYDLVDSQKNIVVTACMSKDIADMLNTSKQHVSNAANRWQKCKGYYITVSSENEMTNEDGKLWDKAVKEFKKAIGSSSRGKDRCIVTANARSYR